MTTFDVPFSSDVLDVDQFVTPAGRSLVAGALVNGRVGLVDYTPLVRGQRPDDSAQEDERAHADSDQAEQYEGRLFSRGWSVKPATKSCRGARFTQDGTTIRTISKDRTVAAIDVGTGQVVRQWIKAHETAPSRILPVPDHPHHFVTGDDDGVIKVWDDRQSATETGASQVFTHHTDWITDLTWVHQMTLPSRIKRDGVGRKKQVVNSSTQGTRDRLVATAGDGILSVMDLRFGTSSKAKPAKAQGFNKKNPPPESEESLWRSGVEISADQEDELLSVRAIRNGTKLVVGTGLGPISIWSPEKGVSDHVDRLAGHPTSVDSIDVLDSSYGSGGDTLLTASSDGMVRIVDLYPHKLLGVAADHGGFPVERVRHAQDWMVSVGHEPFVRLTNLRELLEPASDPDSDSNSDDEDHDEDHDDQVGAVVRAGGRQASMPVTASTPATVASGVNHGLDSDSDNDNQSETEDESDPESLDSQEIKRIQTKATGNDDSHSDSDSDLNSDSDSDAEEDQDGDPDDRNNRSVDEEQNQDTPPAKGNDDQWGSESEDSDAPPRKKHKEQAKALNFSKQIGQAAKGAVRGREKQENRRAFFEDL